MRNLLNFIIRYSTWFVFTFYVLLSCFLLFSRNLYQQSIYLTSANTVSSGIQSVSSGITGYFSLSEVNRNLQESNSRLENEVLNLRHAIAAYQAMAEDSLTRDADVRRFDYIGASVINNATIHPRNYFTINRGSDDGVKTGMGVVNQSGVVGIVNVTGRKTSRVISLLNETQHFSAKLKGTGYIGTLAWKVGNPGVAYLEEVPRHAIYHTGDTVVTSGYSTTFPEGIPIGTVMNRVKGRDDNFYILKIRLAPDFNALGAVRVIVDDLKQEIDSLQSFDYRHED